MKHKLFTFLFCILLLPVLLLPASAREELPLVIDGADLMSSDERLSLEEKALGLAEEYEMDIVILTTDRLEGKTPEAFADDYYDENGYGRSSDHSGILFLLSMEQRDWYITACGDGRYALTDYGIQATAAEALPYLSAGDYYSGFYAWLDILDVYLKSYENGSPIDGYADDSGYHYHGTRETTVFYTQSSGPSFLTALAIGLLCAGITILIMWGAMNTKRPQNSAGSYLIPGSFHLRTQRDLFLYSNVNKTPRPKNTGGGGGSSIHRSASGRRHGGGGGKF